jgi:hypothetical protein
MGAWLQVAKSQELGWRARRKLPDYIDAVLQEAMAAATPSAGS